MIKAIVYLTNTGSTERYAKMLSKAVELPAYPLREASKSLAKNDEIFYMGWIMQGKIKGWSQASMRYKTVGVCGVGMTTAKDSTARDVREKTAIADPQIKVFYAQGGFNMKKLSGVHQLMMSMVRKALKSGAAPAGNDEENKLMLEMLERGGDYVSFDKIEPAAEWIKKYNGRAEAKAAE